MNMIHISIVLYLYQSTFTSLDVRYGEDCGSSVLSNNSYEYYFTELNYIK